jgi:hypothetical protein
MKVIPRKPVFKIKTDDNGNPTRFKFVLVANGNMHTYGEDHFETFALVSRLVMLHFAYMIQMLSIVAQRDTAVI